MARPLLQVIVGSTRPVRTGARVADWFETAAINHGAFDVELIDLAQVGLPFLDEAFGAKEERYEHPHTAAWSATISRADAVVFVMPEYNHGYSAVVKNAVDYLFYEWCDKPAGIVSYGSNTTGGVRAAESFAAVLLSVKALPVREIVTIPFVHRHLTEAGFDAPDPARLSAGFMLDELERLTPASRLLRTTPPPRRALPTSARTLTPASNGGLS